MAEPPYTPKREQSEMPGTIADDWMRVFPHGEVIEIERCKFSARTHPEGDATEYWLAEASDALRMLEDGHGASVDGIEDVRTQLKALGAMT